MNTILERERKFLVNNVNKNVSWDKEHIIYQWFMERSLTKSVKVKLIFDLLNAQCILVRITKKVVEKGVSVKFVEYMDISEFDATKMLGISFVLKRRAIKENVFLDRFLVSNGVCEYLLEVEGEDEINSFSLDEFEIQKEVTQNEAYYNQNMCIPFLEKDLNQLLFLQKIFLWKK